MLKLKPIFSRADMYVEDAVSAQGPISLIVSPSITVAELKQQVEDQFEIPVAVQKWILDKSLVSEDGVTLSSQGVDKDGARVYLYLVSPEEAREAALPAATPTPAPPTSTASGFNKGPVEPVQKGRYWNYEEDRWSVCNSDEDDDDDPVENNNKAKEVAVDSNAARPQNFQFIPAPKEVEAALEAVKEDADKEDVKNVEEAGKEEEGEWEYYYEEEPEKPKEDTKAKPDIEKLVAEHVAERNKEAIAPVAEADGEEAGGWVCPVCTLRNPLERPGCQACTTERPADIGAGAVQEEVQVEGKEKKEVKKENNLDAYKQLENLDIIPNAETFECTICFLETEPGDGVVLRECLHTFCK